MACKTVSAFNEKSTVKGYHQNIKDRRFGVEYFKSFSLVLNALDNIGAFLVLLGDLYNGGLMIAQMLLFP